MTTPSVPSPALVKSRAQKEQWRLSHTGKDRALLNALLPLAFVRECDQEAERLGLSRAAYVAGCLSLASEFSDQIVMRVRLLERQHGIRFRKSGSASPHAQGTSAHCSKVSP